MQCNTYTGHTPRRSATRKNLKLLWILRGCRWLMGRRKPYRVWCQLYQGRNYYCASAPGLILYLCSLSSCYSKNHVEQHNGAEKHAKQGSRQITDGYNSLQDIPQQSGKYDLVKNSRPSMVVQNWPMYPARLYITYISRLRTSPRQ